MAVPEVVRQLVQRFEEHKVAYHSPSYNEAQLRQEFLNPFFEALGWDVSNKKDYAVQYREVIHEDSIHIKGSPNAKAPDYAFRLGGVRKFFVEAKKPSEDIENTKEYAYQLKVYAWNLGLPLSFLTDFEGFAVYDCRNKPNQTDSPAAGRVMYITYDQYLDRWDEIAGIFSPDAIRKGAFDQYAEDNTAKKGTIKVDDAFLQEIETWRTLLARNIALRNSARLTNECQLNYAVQMTISRIIFLRICEDRGIESQNQLLELSKRVDIYQALVALYLKADQKYNSGLFRFKAEVGNHDRVDAFTPGLIIDDKVLKTIIKSLYYPSPYVFKEIPVEILGQVYEQFLGKIIRLTPSGQAKVEEKPEVRKAGGVFYTPKYIVDYIVENTVGKLLAGKTPDEAAVLTIVDPACGSGSFLLGAFQYLLDWHEQWYLEHDPEKFTKGKQPALIHTAEGDWRLTTEEKKRILLNNLYGVDIDAQAVEVTKLSLLLKVLEEETGQLTLGFERALPDLGDNIKCGNSLIGWDYFEGQLIRDEKEVEQVNPFDWEKSFPGVFAKGGFDAVIGNPPYGACLTENEANFLLKNYGVFGAIKDVYLCFIEVAFIVAKYNGFVSFIIPSAWTGGPAYRQLRNYLLNKKINILLLLPFDIFKDAYIDTLIFNSSNSKAKSSHLVSTYAYPKKEKIISIENIPYKKIHQYKWEETDDRKFIIVPELINILVRLSGPDYKRFQDLFSITRGVLFSEKILQNERINNEHFLYFQGDVYRYSINMKLDKWVEFGDKMKEKPKDFHWFTGERILLRRLVNRQQRLMACYVNETFITNKNLYSIISTEEDIFYLLALLNSRFVSYLYINQVTQATKDDFPQVTIRDIKNLPEPVVRNPTLKNRVSSLAQQLLDLNKRNPQTPNDKQRLQREIEATDAQIDRLVYELYGLTDEEIRIVEGDE